ncbi:hypothetical protein A9Q91_04350 [Candidatus Gracilibacteria bacterium 28_42_T64]|nr:hypothetical protein A9Q91_04350 [Candidatus Gracilibacteria bacterium 28_42_T64]
MKNIIYIIPLLFLFGCSYINEEQVIQSKSPETNIDSFLGLTDTDSDNIKDINLVDTSTGKAGTEIPKRTSPDDIKDNTDLNEIGDDTSEEKKETPDTQIVETELVKIENIEIEVDDTLVQETDEEATIIEEFTDEDIEELIDILFETSS